MAQNLSVETRMHLKCSVDDFIHEFEKNVPKHETLKGAYEAAERTHEQLTGNRRYLDYETFRRTRIRRKKSKS